MSEKFRRQYWELSARVNRSVNFASTGHPDFGLVNSQVVVKRTTSETLAENEKFTKNVSVEIIGGLSDAIEIHQIACLTAHTASSSDKQNLEDMKMAWVFRKPFHELKN